MKYLLIFLLAIVPLSAYAYNSGFTPIYQPNTGGSSSVGSIHNIGNVTETGCAEGQILKVNATGDFACMDDEIGAGGESNTASNIGVGYGLFKQKSGVNLEFLNIFCAGDILCSSNSTDVRISYTATAMGSSALDDLTDVIITSPAALSTLFYDGVNWIDKIFSVNSVDIDCTDSQQLNRLQLNNQTGQWTGTCDTDETGSGGGITTLGADVTCTATASYCTVFTIPLTASSGNAIEIKLIADSNTAGAAVQPRVIFDNAGNTGYCTFRTYTTATAEVLDVLAITTSTADTGETVWLAAANTPMPLDIRCGLEGDATPGNAVVQIQMEAASTGTIQKGSFYIKTP